MSRPTLLQQWGDLLRWGAEQGEIKPPLFMLVVWLAGTWLACWLYFGTGK